MEINLKNLTLNEIRSVLENKIEELKYQRIKEDCQFKLFVNVNEYLNIQKQIQIEYDPTLINILPAKYEFNKFWLKKYPYISYKLYENNN